MWRGEFGSLKYRLGTRAIGRCVQTAGPLKHTRCPKEARLLQRWPSIRVGRFCLTFASLEEQAFSDLGLFFEYQPFAS
jgi:hypothetical protein